MRWEKSSDGEVLGRVTDSKCYFLHEHKSHTYAGFYDADKDEEARVGVFHNLAEAKEFCDRQSQRRTK